MPHVLTDKTNKYLFTSNKKMSSFCRKTKNTTFKRNIVQHEKDINNSRQAAEWGAEAKLFQKQSSSKKARHVKTKDKEKKTTWFALEIRKLLTESFSCSHSTEWEFIEFYGHLIRTMERNRSEQTQ